MEIKCLKEKWVVRWEEILEIGKKEHKIQCSNWFNSEKEAKDFVKSFQKEKPIREKII